MKKLSFSPEAVKPVAPEAMEEVADLDTRIALIQALIPLGLHAVQDLLQQEVAQLAGARYQRKEADQPHRRWGQQQGSVYLADQKLRIQVPRVRNVETQTEVPLESYQALQIPLGFVQAATENERVCRLFIDTLIQRGLHYEEGLLVLIDGAKGLYHAITKALKGYVVIQRCQWHKRENIVSYLAPEEQRRFRKKLKDAYDQPIYEDAKKALDNLKAELALLNQSALHSLEEGFEETLTLHRLGMMPYLKMSFRTTNCIESLNRQIAQLTDNVKAWKNSSQRHRWLAAALLDIEPRLRKVKGMRFLPLLRQAIQTELELTTQALSA